MRRKGCGVITSINYLRRNGAVGNDSVSWRIQMDDVTVRAWQAGSTFCPDTTS